VLLKLMQFAIVVAVVGSNGQYHWTPNGYVAALAGGAAALIVTLLIVAIGNLLLILKKKFNHQRIARSRAGW
jgi:hypothetical protein